MSQPTASSRLLTCQRKLQSMQEDHWEFCLLSYRLNHMQLDCIYNVAQRSGPETTVCLEFGAAEVQGEAQCALNINV